MMLTPVSACPPRIQIWINDKILIQYRQPYVRFFLWAYMNADAESDQYNINDLQYQKEMWTFLGMLAAHIKSVAEQVRTACNSWSFWPPICVAYCWNARTGPPTGPEQADPD